MQKINKYVINQLKSFIKVGDTAKALEQLEKIAEQISTDFYNQFINLSGRYHRLKRERESGQLYEEPFRVETARINVALTSLIDGIDDKQQLKATIDAINKSIDSEDNLNIEIPDNKELEKIIGKDELLDINWLEKALKASRSVCKVLLPNSAGSGFLLKGGYLLTNNHVISSKESAARAKAIFNFKIDANGYPQRTCEYTFDPTFYLGSPFEELDYALVKVVENKNIPIAHWGYLKLDNFSDPQIGDKVNIIQHPEGRPMKMAMPDKIISVWKQYLFYIADTKGGSSGSPVFNQEWKVIALHHAGRNDLGVNGGLQINEQGENRPANRGILIKRVLEDLKAKGFSF